MAAKMSYEDVQTKWKDQGQHGLGRYIVLPADRLRQVRAHLKNGTWDDYNNIRAIHYGGFDSLQDAKAFISNNPKRDFGVSPVRILDVTTGEAISPLDVKEGQDVSQFKKLVENEEVISTDESGGYVLEVLYDESDEGTDPRNWSNVGTMITFHQRYPLPNEAGFQIDSGDFNDWNEVKAYIEEQEDDGIAAILSLSMTDHSGINLYVGKPRDKWDSGYVGFIYATQVAADEEGLSGTALENQLRNEVQIYNQWLNGNIYRWRIRDDFGTEVDGVGDYFDLDTAKREGLNALHSLVKRKAARDYDVPTAEGQGTLKLESIKKLVETYLYEARGPIDIGDGFYLTRAGMDTMGNYSVWVSLGANQAKKIQTNGNTPAAHHKRVEDIAADETAKQQIKDYYNTYMKA